MTFIDSVDSIVMLYSYAGFPDRKFALVEEVRPIALDTTRSSSEDPELLGSPVKSPSVGGAIIPVLPSPLGKTPSASVQELPRLTSANDLSDDPPLSAREDDFDSRNEELQRQLRVKRNAMSGLSIALTLMSILVAFTYVHCYFSYLNAHTSLFSVSH